jgi:hypothetical protein
LKRTWPFIWTNLNSIHPRIICAKFDWIWPAGSEEEDFKNFQCIFTLLLLSPLGERLSPSFDRLNKLESPSPKDNFVVPSMVNWSNGSEEEVENVKVDRRTDRRTPDNQESSFDLSAQGS